MLTENRHYNSWILYVDLKLQEMGVKVTECPNHNVCWVNRSDTILKLSSEPSRCLLSRISLPSHYGRLFLSKHLTNIAKGTTDQCVVR